MTGSQKQREGEGHERGFRKELTEGKDRQSTLIHLEERGGKDAMLVKGGTR